MRHYSAALFFCGPFTMRPEKKKNNHSNSRFVLILIIACLYGVATELMQKYLIPNRDYDIYDILADSIGAVLGIYICIIDS
ncbi:MAG: VanZ family protein [Puia sp.]